MDCEKFESLLIDELYGELDEVTSAAVRRHAAGCARCGALLSGLRATRKVAALPMEEPSADLEDRILSAVREQQKVLPLRARASSVLSRAGAWAMRPQTAMAAVFLLVIGTSFVLVQTRKEMHAASSNAEGSPVMQAAAASAAATSFALEKESAFAHGVEEKRAEAPKAMPSAPAETLALADDRERSDKSKDEAAKKNFDTDGITNAGPIGGVAANDLTTVTKSSGVYGGQGQALQPGGGGGGAGGGGASVNGNGGNGPPPATQQVQANTGWSALQQAKARKQQTNCASLDQLRGQANVGNEATLEAARCYRDIGNSNVARQRYSSLQSTPYATTAQQEMDAMAPVAAHRAQPSMPQQVQAAPPPRATATATTAPAQAKPTDQKGAATY